MGNNFSRRVTYEYKIFKVTKFSVNFSSISATLSFSPRQPVVMRASPEIGNALGLRHKAFCISLRTVENPQQWWKGCFFSQCNSPLEHHHSTSAEQILILQTKQVTMIKDRSV